MTIKKRVARLSDRLGEYDDTHVIYRADDPEQRFAWGTASKVWIATKMFSIAFLVVVGALVGPGLACLLLIGLGLAELVWYVIWRRRRNRRLTGSPTRWPTREPADAGRASPAVRALVGAESSNDTPRLRKRP
jgi:hypothetical protein